MQSEKRPTRISQEEKALVAQLKENKTHCYFCNKPLDIDKDKCSTEFGIFYACGECYPKWGNPDREPLEGEGVRSTGRSKKN